MADIVKRKVIITTTGGSKLQLSDYKVSGYVDCISTWGAIAGQKLNPLNFSTTPGTASFKVINNMTIGAADRFTNISGVQFGTVQIFQGGDELFYGVIDEIVDISHLTCTINCVTIDSSLSKKFLGTKLTVDNFPSVDPTDAGKMLPIVYGNPKRVPFLGVDVAVTTRLRSPLLKGDTYIMYGDFSLFASSGYVDIDTERIAYTTSANGMLLSLTRGEDSTEDTYHPTGALVTGVKSEHVYAIGNIVDSIDAVYLGDQLLDLDYLPFGASATLYPDGHESFPNFACIGLSYTAGFSIGGSKMGLKTSIIGDIPPTESRIIPTLSAPTTDGDAWDGDLDTFYNSYSDGYYETDDYIATWDFNLTEWADGVNYRFIAFKFPDVEDGWGVENHICIKASAATTVYLVSAGPETGNQNNFYDCAFVVEEGHAMTDNVTPFSPLYGESDCPEWQKEVPYSGAEWADSLRNWTFVFWPDSDSAHIQITEIHRSLIPVLISEDAGDCPEPCPYCPESPTTSTKSIASYAASGITTGNMPITLQNAVNTSPFEWDRLYADVTGYGDNDASAICEDILNTLCLADLDIDHSVEGNDLDIVITEFPDIPDLLTKIAIQSNCVQTIQGSTHYLKSLSGVSSGNTIESIDVDENALKISYTNKNEVVNKISYYYNFYWWSNSSISPPSTAEIEDTTSQGIYGELQSTFNFAFLSGSSDALAVGNRLLTYLKNPRLLVEYTGGFSNNENKVSNFIGFNTSNSNVSRLTVGLVESTDIFILCEQEFLQNKVRLLMVKVPSS